MAPHKPTLKGCLPVNQNCIWSTPTACSSPLHRIDAKSPVQALFFRLTRAVSWFLGLGRMSRRMLLQSRQFSCSELGDGSRELVATKQETLNDDDLEANIKARGGGCV